MNGKHQRQATIRRIIRTRPVTTQQQLLEALRKLEMKVNQATLSRDLTELGIRKAGSRYVVQASEEHGPDIVNSAAAVRSFATCGPHMIVIRTGTGQAQTVGVAIDAAADPSIMATLSGDDTIFLATKTRRTQSVALRRLEQWFGDKHER
ncbi:MAG: hypothetical protein MI923_16460 [Phycisphaerales bacterium]|nr:hypothetical protein [Phycisphaerales bacterium]